MTGDQAEHGRPSRETEGSLQIRFSAPSPSFILEGEARTFAFPAETAWRASAGPQGEKRGQGKSSGLQVFQGMKARAA